MLLPSKQLSVIYYGDTAPSGPATNDLWWETDTNILWFWNGTYWLSVQRYKWHTSWANLSGNTSGNYYPIRGSHPVDYDFYLEDMCISGYVATTNNGSNYWTVKFYRHPSVTSLASKASSSWSPDAWTIDSVDISAHLDVSASGDELIYFNLERTLTPGVFLGGAEINYRLAHL